MTFAVTSPVNGSAQTGFTSPTYTIAADVAPTINGKQWAVTAVAGAGNTPRVHSISDPFTITMTRAAVLKQLPTINSQTGRYGSIPKNTHVLLVRKGLNYAANQSPETGLVRCEISVPAGADAYNPIDVRAMLSLFGGAYAQNSAGIGDTAVTGVP